MNAQGRYQALLVAPILELLLDLYTDNYPIHIKGTQKYGSQKVEMKLQ